MDGRRFVALAGHGGKQLAGLTKLPVHAVGDTTADAARRAGFLVGRTGRGGLQNLLDDLANRKLHLLRLAGEDRVTLRVPDNLEVDTRIDNHIGEIADQLHDQSEHGEEE